MGPNRWIGLGSICALLAVAAGAFAAHGLKGKIPAESLAAFEVGARYQMYHALALLVVGVLCRETRRPARGIEAAGWCFLAGIVLFSGSLYGLALTGQGGLGAVTPFGGLCFLGGWATLGALFLLRRRNDATE